MKSLRVSGTCGLAVLLGAGLWTCTFEEMPSDEVCKDVGYSIANRVLACTGDRTLSEERYDQYKRDYACRVFGNREYIEKYYECPVAVRNVPCEEVIATGSDLDAWLAPLPYCANILEHSDGTPIEGAVWDGGVADGEADSEADGAGDTNPPKDAGGAE